MRRDNDGVKVMGYYDSEHTKNVRDWKEVFDYTVEEPTMMPASLDPNYHKELTHWYNQWPQYPPEFRYYSFKYFCMFILMIYLIVTR